MSLTDYPGYRARREQVDLLLLTLAANGDGYRCSEGDAALFAGGIGNARHGSRLELAQSSTGAIHRAAVCDLQSRGFLRRQSRPSGEPFGLPDGRTCQPSYMTFRLTRAGRTELQRLTQP